MLWIWRNFRMELPAEWELIQFSKNAGRGRCEFADRYAIRMEFSWRAAESEPDMNRLVNDWNHRLHHEKDIKDVRSLKPGRWHGFHGTFETHQAAYYFRYFAEESCIVQVVFVWPDQREEKKEVEIIKTVKPEATRSGNRCRWKAFGMDIAVPASLHFIQCKVKTAYARFQFAVPGTDNREMIFFRRGMVREWLKKPVRTWLKANMPRKFKETSRVSREIQGHTVELIEGRRTAPGMGRLLGKKDYFYAASWICPEDNRLYYCQSISDRPGPANGQGRIPEDLSCCDAIKLKP